ncbi:MAG: uracil-DNA glycosylase [bacterium TMED80]|nr:MAG: uracil-DNA glycosylase [bacterium TMED80]RZP24185.1 MAG: uracil-DNA glycosylase [bacterium]|tara:strand:- start:51 stop:728 length:678 start_codon:yes stop_codon:yes gene_type:complete
MDQNIKKVRSEIISCKRCPRLVEFRTKIAKEKRKSYMDWDYWGKPVPGYGDDNSKLLILGLAPAAHGGNRTGRVFTGDKSADFLFKCMHAAGLANQPESIAFDDGLTLNGFMSVAVKCVPPGDKPTAEERNNCASHLANEIECLHNMEIVLGLGKIGFESFLHYTRKSHDIKMKDFPFKHGVGYELPSGVTLYGAYHPSPRNVNTKRITFDMMVKFLKNLKNEIQ